MNYQDICLPQVHMDRKGLTYRKLGGTDGTGVCMGLAPFNVQVLTLIYIRTGSRMVTAVVCLWIELRRLHGGHAIAW